ncbi:hypothetical protein KCU78_g4415, partial [Aureobasidium melanogenum]
MKRQASQELEAYDSSSQPNKRQRNDQYSSVNQNNMQANTPHAHAPIRPPPPLPRLDYTTFLCYQVVTQTGQTTYAFPGGWTLSCMNQNNMPPALGSFPSALPLPQLDYTTLLSSHIAFETGHTMFHFPAGWTLLSPRPRSWYDQPNEWQGHAHSAQLQKEIFCDLQCMYQSHGYRSSFAQGSDGSMFVAPPSHPRSSPQGAGNIGLALDLTVDPLAGEFDLDAVEFDEDC